MTKKVKCRVCNKLVGRVNHNHLQTHGMTTQEYKLKFPSASTISDTDRKNIAAQFSKRVSGYWKDPAYAAIKAKQLRVDRKRVRASNPELFRNLGIAQLRLINADPTLRYHPETLRKRSDGMKRAWDNKTAQEIIEHAKRSGGKAKRHRVSHKGKKLYLRSSLELKCFKELKAAKLDFDYESVVVKYKKGKRWHCYIPDFILGGLIVECKPDFLLEEPVVASKRRASIKAGYKYVFYTGKETLASVLRGGT